MSFEKILIIQLKPNKNLAVILAILHFLVLIAIILTEPLSAFLLSLLIIAMMGSYIYYYRWHIACTLNKSITEVRVNALGDWSLSTFAGETIKSDLLCNSFVSQYLIILNFCSDNSAKHTVLITKSRIDADKFRHLKVHLKIEKCTN